MQNDSSKRMNIIICKNDAVLSFFFSSYDNSPENDQYPVNATEAAILCSFQCNPMKNPSYDCMPICSDICPESCYTSPAISPPYDGGYIYTTPPKHHHVSLSLPLKISLFILVITFSLFLLYTLYKFYTVWYRARFRRSPSPENQETNEDFVDHDIIDHPIWYIRTIGLNPSVISAITVVKYKKTDEIIDGTSCSVCLSDFQENEALRLLPKCNHAFHISCIDTWLRSHTNCPLCRAGIVKNVTDNNNNSLSLDENLGGSGTGEEARVEISVREDGDVEEGQRVVDGDDQRLDLRIRVDDDDYENSKADGSSGTSDFFIIRRSVSLNDYAACRVRNDVLNHTNNYYSDRHDVQIRSLDGGNMGFDLVKVEQTPNNRDN